MPPTRVLIADDNPVVRTGLISLLEASDCTVVAEAADGAHALQAARTTSPDVVLLDVRMPLVDGISVVERLSATAKVIMVTNSDAPETVRAAMRNGAAGYLVYGAFSCAELGQAICDAVRGAAYPLSPAAVRALVETVRDQSRPHEQAAALGLSKREGDVMANIARGLTNAKIAQELVISEKTVKNHINRIFTKLCVTSRAAALAKWNGNYDEARG